MRKKQNKLLYTGTNTKQEEHKKMRTLSHVQWNSNDNILVKLYTQFLLSTKAKIIFL